MKRIFVVSVTLALLLALGGCYPWWRDHHGGGGKSDGGRGHNTHDQRDQGGSYRK